MELRIKSSEDGFDEIFKIVNDIAVLKNPHLFWDLQSMDVLQCNALIDELLDDLKEKLG